MNIPELRPGTRLRSTACPAEVIVIRTPPVGGVVECGGQPMTAAEEGAAGVAGTGTGEVQLGKRYTDAAETIELLCTMAGNGPLTLDGVALTQKASKPLPASD